MTMRLRPAMAYRLRDCIQNVCWFVGVMTVLALLVLVGGWIGQRNAEMEGMVLSAFGTAATITMFVVGICTIRESMRMLLQNGVGRKTTLMTEMIMSFATCLVLAIVGEIFTWAEAMAAGAISPSIVVTDMYQMTYGQVGAVMNLGERASSAVMNLGAMFCAYALGMFFSMMFYRLPKKLIAVVAIALYGGATVGLSFLALRLPWLFGGFASFVMGGLGNLLVVMVIFAALMYGALYLLIRRAPVNRTR